ncbi:CAP domain-containing protein [Chitinophaga rhizophila]|uniref:CAP domain-containing protein n=1 Tax=Chitinophaga rhizophila TaxID=2866212 RepID=A0ABS7GIZ4_9BACT|nr:CAP domain-containing protein [Chitinophaga rhizophila]MBW8687687.1 CAP domain-containing protein [Chitinophaga rhizophila]
MNRKLSFAVFAFFLTFHLFVFSCSRSAAPVKGSATSVNKPTSVSEAPRGDGNAKLIKDILYYTNEFRASKGLPPLKLESFCSELAQKHSNNMATGKVAFGHDQFEIRNDAATLKFKGISGVAENVAYGNLDAKGVVDGWIKSPGHRKNMLGNYNLIGIGTAQKGKIIYFTQFFVKK